MTNTRAYSAALAQAASDLLAASGEDVTQPVKVLPLAKRMAQETGCHISTAKQHIARAARLARHESTEPAAWGGTRPGAGGPKGKKAMNRHYYAARHTHGRDFSYDGGGWTAYTFESKAERDAFVAETNDNDRRAGYNARSESCTRDDARKIAGSRVKEVRIPKYLTGRMLDYDVSYPANYWG